ncbi:MAG: hypothetical protein LBD50_00060 [Rickettsiales bacterium]|jgi:hypothetical protein|nr:hypothetical protein [Rickettsiales bacterium]
MRFLKVKFFILCAALCLLAYPAAATYNAENAAAWGDFWWKRNAWDLPDLNSSTGVNVYLTPAGGRQLKAPANSTDEEIAIVFMARVLVPNGGYFCTTQLRSRNEGSSKTKKVWTQYQEVGGGSKCYWLCKNRYGGDGCTSEVSGSCSGGTLTKAKLQENLKFNETGGYDNMSVESQIWNSNGIMDRGGSDKKNEQEVIVVATQFMEKGVKAKAVTFTAHCGSRSRNDSLSCSNGNSGLKVVDSLEKGVSPEITLCLNGYSGAECAPANPTECSLQNMCAGYEKSLFNQSEHVVEAGKCSNGQDGNIFRCADSNKGFKSDSDKSCVDCGGAPRNGVNPTTGVCVKCETGKKIDSNGQCQPVSATYNQKDLLYGKNNDENIGLAQQCWINIVPDEYKSCVVAEIAGGGGKLSVISKTYCIFLYYAGYKNTFYRINFRRKLIRHFPASVFHSLLRRAYFINFSTILFSELFIRTAYRAACPYFESIAKTRENHAPAHMPAQAAGEACLTCCGIL